MEMIPTQENENTLSIDLSNEMLEKTFLPFLSLDNEFKEPVENWRKQGFDQSFIETFNQTFKYKSDWEGSKAKLTEVFNNLVNSERARESLKAQDQVMEAALDSLEKALLDFYEIIKHLSHQEREQGIGKIYFNDCLLKIQKLDDLLGQATLGFENFPHLPRLIYITAHILQVYLKLNPQLENSGLINRAFDRINAEIESTMVVVFWTRYDKIKFQRDQEDFRGYVYDEYTKYSLTERVEFDETTKLEQVYSVLQERIADLYVQSLPFQEVCEIVDKLWGQGKTVSWAILKDNYLCIDLADESNAELLTSVKELTPIWVQQSYFPHFLEEIQLVQVQPKGLMRDLAQEATENIMRHYAIKLAEKTGSKIIKASVSTVFGPLFGAFFDTIWPGEQPLTRKEVADIVNLLINKALKKEKAEEIKRVHDVTYDSYNTRFIIVREYKSMGEPRDWETVLNQTYNLQTLIFHTDSNIEYLTHQLLPSTIIMRVLSLMGAYRANQDEGIDVANLKQKLEELLKAWYQYLERLLNQALSKTRETRKKVKENDLYPETFMTSREDYDFWVKNKVRNQVVSPTTERYGKTLYSGLSNNNQANIAVEALGNRIDYYVILNTQLDNMCKAYDLTVEELKKAEMISLSGYPTNAWENIFKTRFLTNNYVKKASDLEGRMKKETLLYPPDKKPLTWRDLGRWDLCLFSRQDTNRGASYDDPYVFFYDGSVKLQGLSVGDYPNLAEILPSNVTHISLPIGLVAVLYNDVGFKGNRTAYPLASNRETLKHQLYTKPGSMKVRIDVGPRWFPPGPHKPAGREVTKFDSTLCRLDTNYNWNDPEDPFLVDVPDSYYK
jgi:hypothetical protein